MVELNKIYNCDCFDGMKDIPDGSVDMILCDLPYGTTDLAWDVCLPLDKLWAEYKRVTKPNAAILLFAQQPFATDLIIAARKMFRYEIIWHKTQPLGFLNAKKMPLRIHENILVFYCKLPTYNPQRKMVEHAKVGAKKKSVNGLYREMYRGADWSGVYSHYTKVGYVDDGKRSPDTVIKFSNWNGTIFGRKHKGELNNFHPTQKPVDLCEYLIKTYSDEGDTILDNCSGSGTTAIAAMNTGRNFICYEKDAGYWEKSVRRLEGGGPAPIEFKSPLPSKSYAEGEALDLFYPLFANDPATTVAIT